MKRQLFYLSLLALSSLFFTSCTDENNYGTEEGDSITKKVSISMKMPGDMNQSPSTYAMTQSEEQEVKTIDVLAFVRNAANQYMYSYQAKGRNLSIANGIGTFEVDVKQYAENQVFVVLANSSTELVSVQPTPTEKLDDVLARMIIRSNTEWSAKNNGAAALRYIPMYGKSAITTISNTTSNLAIGNLVRMLARIDISTKSTIPTTTFQLTEACIFNRKDRGYISYKDSNWDNTDRKVTNADMPTAVQTTKLNSILYRANASHKVQYSIYTFETTAVMTRADATAIVVGGKYNGAAATSYYRIDIPKSFVANHNGDILRNHLYDIEIQSVAKKGAATPEEAFDGAVEIDATVTAWNLAKQVIVGDGPDRLTMSKDAFVLDKSAGSRAMTVTTTSLSGIAIKDIQSVGNWLTVTSTGTGNNEVLTVSVDANSTGADRSGQFTIVSDNINYVVKVDQTSELWLKWSNDQIFYNAGEGYLQDVISLEEWDLTISDPYGCINKFYRLDHGGGVGYGLMMNQINHADMFQESILTFTDPAGNYAPVSYSVVISGQPNCYMVAPGGTVVIPTIRKAYKVVKYGDGISGPLTPITSSSITAEVVWQSSPGLISSPPQVIGADDDASISVTTDNIPGNAVVAVKIGGVIRWSWHIWVVNYLPYSHINRGWVDRNIGASERIDPTIASSGLLYQWGRKDPFPAANAKTGSTQDLVVYDGNGVAITQIDKVANTGLNNLEYSIANPRSFIVGAGGNVDWYTSGSFQSKNERLWLVDRKTLFDPCPDGYRIPPLTDWDMLTPIWDATNFGHLFYDSGGYYPASGYRDGGTGDMVNAGPSAYVWSATPASGESSYLGWKTPTEVVARTETFQRGFGLHVRCRKW